MRNLVTEVSLVGAFRNFVTEVSLAASRLFEKSSVPFKSTSIPRSSLSLSYCSKNFDITVSMYLVTAMSSIAYYKYFATSSSSPFDCARNFAVDRSLPMVSRNFVTETSFSARYFVTAISSAA